MSAGAIVIDFDKDMKEDVLQISQDRKRINFYRKSVSFHKLNWHGMTLFDVRNATDLQIFGGDQDYKITSLIVDDINNDDQNDLVIGIDINLEDGSEKTVIVRAIQQQRKFQFTLDKLDPDVGKFLIVDTAPFENGNYKDYLVFTKSQKIALIKNYDPTWLYIELSNQTVVSPQIYQDIEKLNSLAFHLYILDYDKDGYLDIVFTNYITNKLVYISNPGANYWREVSKITQSGNKQKQMQELKKIQKWNQKILIQSSYSDTIQDFVLVNIDSEDKLVIIVLYSYSINWYYPFEKVTQNNRTITYKEKKIMINGKTHFDFKLSNIYDADVSNDNEVQFIVFSKENQSIQYIKRDIQPIMFQWSSNFWIYIIMYIHILALLFGIFHFIFFSSIIPKQFGNDYSSPNLIELANRDASSQGWNMENIVRKQSEQEGVHIDDWDPQDPSKKKIKKQRKLSFDQSSAKKQRRNK